MTNIPMPRLMDRTFRQISRPEPVSLAIEMNLKGLSTATMVLPGIPSIETGYFLELYTQQGSAGFFRVEQLEQDYPTATRLTLKHSLVTLAESRCVLARPGTPQSAPALFREIIAQQSLWQCGAIEAPETLLVTPEGDGSLLEALEALMAALPDYHLAFDQSTTPWTLHLQKFHNNCTTECRLTRNISSLQVETDRSSLCTQLYLPGIETPLLADTAERWGIVSGQLSASSHLTEEELRALGQQYLEQHKNPQITITMEAIDLCRLTGAALDAFHLGGLCRICLPGSETPLLQRIVRLSWPDVFGAPDVVHVALATTAANTSSLISGLVVDTTRVKKQMVRQWDEMTVQKEILLAAQEQITLLSQNITINATEMLTLRAGLDDASAEIVLLDGRITANADAITLKADQASLELANNRINAQASAIALKADQASLELANNRINAQASAIALKADKIDLQGFVTATQLETSYAKIADLNSLSAQVTNLTGGLVTAAVLRSTLFTGNQANFTFLTADAFNLGSELVTKRSITMGNVTSAGKALATGELDLNHSHEVTVDANGNLKLGGVAADGGNFNIAETQFYKDGVSASYADGYEVGFDRAQNAYTPTSVSRSGYDTASKTVYVDVGNAYQPLLTRKPIDATEIYNAGWNECIDHCSATVQLHRITQASPGTLYMLQGNNYVSVGSSWVQVAAVYNTYFIPERK